MSSPHVRSVYPFIFLANILLVALNSFIFYYQWKNGEKSRNFPVVVVEKNDSYCDCEKLIKYILRKQSFCHDKSNNIVEICLEFSSDYEYLWPFLMHHYAIGISRIHLYNNEIGSSSVLFDPGLNCLAESGFLIIKPWPGYGVQREIQNNCFEVIKSNYYKSFPYRSPNLLWGINIDVDEMIVLHNHSCIGEFLDHFSQAPGVVLNWALFPPLPSNYSKYSLTDKSSSHQLLFPYEMMLYKAKESVHIKSIVRVQCFDTWDNPHFPNYKYCSGFNNKSVDVQNRPLTMGKKPPSRIQNYQIAQLNHYWTYSFRHFLRKMHRGESFHEKMVYRSSQEYFDVHLKHPHIIYDDHFPRKYGKAIREGELLCPHLIYWKPQLPVVRVAPHHFMIRQKTIS